MLHNLGGICEERIKNEFEVRMLQEERKTP